MPSAKHRHNKGSRECELKGLILHVTVLINKSPLLSNTHIIQVDVDCPIKPQRANTKAMTFGKSGDFLGMWFPGKDLHNPRLVFPNTLGPQDDTGRIKKTSSWEKVGHGLVGAGGKGEPLRPLHVFECSY